MSKMNKVEAAVKAIHADLQDTLGDVSEAWATTKRSVIRLLDKMMGSSDAPADSKAKGSTAKKAGKGKGKRVRRKFTDEQKAKMVADFDAAVKEGSTKTAAAKALKVSAQQIDMWRKPKAKKAKAEAK